MYRHYINFIFQQTVNEPITCSSTCPHCLSQAMCYLCFEFKNEYSFHLLHLGDVKLYSDMDFNSYHQVLIESQYMDSAFTVQKRDNWI